MVSLSWIDIHYLGKEVTSELEYSKIENIYGNHEELHIKLYKSGQKNSFISAFLNKGIFLMNNEKYQHNSKNIFIQFLRKKLKNGMFECCFTYERERVVTLKFSVKNQETKEFETYYLHIELFMGGQVTLCNNKNQIIRQLKQLSIPQSSSQNLNENSNQISLEENSNNSNTYELFNTKLEELNQLKREKKNISDLKEEKNKVNINNLLIKKDNLLKTLTLEEIDLSKNLQDSLKFLGIGKKYIFYLELLLNISNQTPLEQIETNILNILIKEISNLLEYSNSTTLLYSKNSKDDILLPFNPTEQNSNLISTSKEFEFENFEELFSLKLKELYKKSFIPKDTSLKEPAKLTKLKKRLEDQEKNLKKINEQSEKLELQASSFYEHYQELQNLQNKINSIIKEENGFKILKEKIKENPTLKKLITQVNDKDKSVTINTKVFEELKNK